MRVSYLESPFGPTNENEVDYAHNVSNAKIAWMNHRCVGVRVTIFYPWISKPIAIHVKGPRIELFGLIEAPFWRFVERQQHDETEYNEVTKWNQPGIVHIELSTGLEVIAHAHYFFQLEVEMKVSTGLRHISVLQSLVKILCVPNISLLFFHVVERALHIKVSVLVVVRSVYVQVFIIFDLIFSVDRTMTKSISLILSSKDLWLV